MTKRILITRLSHIGDCVLTLPMANSIKRNFPDSKLTWVVEKPSDQLIGLNDSVDETLLVSRGWMKRPRECWRLRNELRRRKFDVALDPQGITKSSLLGWLSGAKQRWGVQGRWGRELSTYLNNRLIKTSNSHVVDRSLDLAIEFAKANGVKQTRDNRDLFSARELFQMDPNRESVKTIDRWLDVQKIDRYIVVNPGASWASKRWELDRFAEVIRETWRRHQYASVLTWAGADEKQMVETIAKLAPMSIIAPKTSLVELAAFCQQAEFFLGCDTGPLHIATAVGARCVGLYGTTRPEESGAYGQQHLAIQERYQAGSCRERRSAPNEAMREITAERVITEINRWIDSWRCEAA